MARLNEEFIQGSFIAFDYVSISKGVYE